MSARKKYGCVALLDALGTQSGSVPDAESFLSFLEVTKQACDDYKHLELGVGEHLKVAKDISSRFFGDTILLTLATEDHTLHWLTISMFSAYIANMISVGFELSIFFRGAIAIGEYIEGEHAILGPAINDAASWYEQPEIIGVMFTPGASHTLEWLTLQPTFKLWELQTKSVMALPYQVPVKGGETIDSYLIDWVEHLNDNAEDAKSTFYKTLGKQVITRELHCKYKNTVDYFEFSLKRRDDGTATTRQ